MNSIRTSLWSLSGSEASSSSSSSDTSDSSDSFGLRPRVLRVPRVPRALAPLPLPRGGTFFRFGSSLKSSSDVGDDTSSSEVERRRRALRRLPGRARPENRAAFLPSDSEPADGLYYIQMKHQKPNRDHLIIKYLFRFLRIYIMTLTSEPLSESSFRRFTGLLRLTDFSSSSELLEYSTYADVSETQ